MTLVADRDYRIPSGCSIMGIMDESGKPMSGEGIVRGMSYMRERGNGLGGGFAAYGIYPGLAQYYAFHLLFEDQEARRQVEKRLRRFFEIVRAEPIPTRYTVEITAAPLLWRYFLEVKSLPEGVEEEELVVMEVCEINTTVEGAFVISSGKNMGVFKGVGYPEDIGRFYRLEEYQAYIWTGHGRFPTNSVAWWGGAHPFGLLDWSVVHNGEISSYGANRRFLEHYGYHCSLFTDTEVITYIFDLLVRKHGLSVDLASRIIAPRLWRENDVLPNDERDLNEALRVVYAGALLNGPFSVIVARQGLMIGLNDRVKLRPMVAARDGDRLYLSSEEAPIRILCRLPREVWSAEAGQPIIGCLKPDAAVA